MIIPPQSAAQQPTAIPAPQWYAAESSHRRLAPRATRLPMVPLRSLARTRTVQGRIRSREQVGRDACGSARHRWHRSSVPRSREVRGLIHMSARACYARRTRSYEHADLVYPLSGRRRPSSLGGPKAEPSTQYRVCTLCPWCMGLEASATDNSERRCECIHRCFEPLSPVPDGIRMTGPALVFVLVLVGC